MRRFVFGFMTGIATTILVIVGSLAAVGHALRVEDPLAPADAIVSVSGDAGPRVRTAVALWRQGYAPVIVFSGAARDPESVSSAEIMKREAMRLGVPGERILLEEGSSTTQQNAEKVAELLPSVGLRSAILVTSPYHQRRAAMHFEREFESAGLELRNYPAEDPRWDPTLWWVAEPSRSLTIVELAKLAFEALDGRVQRPPASFAGPQPRSSP